MRTQDYENLSLACFVAGNVATVGALGTWLAGRLLGNHDRAHDGLFLAVIGGAFFAVGNRLALASHDRAAHARWAGDANLGSVQRAWEAAEREPLVEADDGQVQSPRPLQHVKHGAGLGAGTPTR